MSFQAFMERVLPPSEAGGVKPHISGSVFTSYRDRPRTNNQHAAVDFNYIGGQAFNTQYRFKAYSPVEGTLEFAGGDYGTIKIRDDEGYSHEILHLNRIPLSVLKVGQRVSIGTILGLLGGKGPQGEFQYQIHIHYQLRNPSGTLIDPVAFWDGQEQVYTAPLNPEGFDYDTHSTDEAHYRYEPADPQGFVEEFIPRLPGKSTYSEAQRAVWTNRVPQHEPWPRMMMVDTKHINAPTDEHEQNVNHNPQFDNDNYEAANNINRVFGDEVVERGPFWRR